MNIKEFNKKLAFFTNDAKISEKGNPEKAKNLWLKICEFALEFSKQPGIERSFRLKLWKHIENIIKRLKKEEIIPQQEGVPFVGQSMNEELEFDLSKLPSVPTNELDEINEEKTEETRDSNYSDIINDTLKDEEKNKKDLLVHISKEEGKESEKKTFFDNLAKLEEELKKMPDIFKEVTPTPYSPEDTIIKIKKEDNGYTIDNEDTVLPDIQISTEDRLNIKPINLDNDNVDVYKGTKDIDKIEDPFAEGGKADTDKKKIEVFCYACGAKIKSGAKECPKCGTKL
ncbi:MAG: zinc ribbon domain-containing protein [Promethearchaeota archaeon]